MKDTAVIQYTEQDKGLHFTVWVGSSQILLMSTEHDKRFSSE